MTKQEAIQSLEAGKKVTHDYFEPEEFVYMKDGEIYDEGGHLLKGANWDFWTDRQGEHWETGWSLFE